MSVPPVAGSGMYDNPCRFIQHQKRFILKEDLQGNRLAFDFERGRLRDIPDDLIAGANFQGWFGLFAIDRYRAVLDQPLDTCAGQAGGMAAEEDVEAFRMFAGGNR